MKRWILSGLTAVALVLGLATPAMAYTSGSCYVGGNTSARMSVTKWDSGYWIGSMHVIQTTYHMDLNSAGTNHADYILADSYKFGAQDQYWNVGTPYSYQHTFTGVWWFWYWGGSISHRRCTVIL